MTTNPGYIESHVGDQKIAEDRAIRLFGGLDEPSAAERNWDMPGIEQPEWLAKAHNVHKGKRIFMIGSGPSLIDQLPILHKLRDEHTWTVNRIARWKELPFTPTYHSIAEPGPVVQWGQGILPIYDFPAVPDRIAIHWFPVTAPGWLWAPKAPDDVQMRWQGFWGLGDFLPPVPSGWASPLTTAQIAAWFGYDEFYFLGIDTTQTGQAWDKVGGRTKVMRSILTIEECFDRARQEIEKAGRRIVDCTPGGRINERGILPYEELEKVLG